MYKPLRYYNNFNYINNLILNCVNRQLSNIYFSMRYFKHPVLKTNKNMIKIMFHACYYQCYDTYLTVTLVT